jgi:branched-chain amino acid transport system substrate-binding protein
VTSRWMKPVDDPAWQGDEGVSDYLAFMKQWAPGRDPMDSANQISYSNAMVLVDVLKRCGDQLTRANLLDKATNIRALQLPLFLKGVEVNVSPNDRVAWRQAQLTRFEGDRWKFFGDILSVSAGE